jgi:predicted kinase
MPDPTGSAQTVLVIIRGNSGSGKSSIARRLRHGYGRGCALVEQDHLRRIVLRERDRPGGLAPHLIEATVRFALDHGYHVILEGILHSGRYGAMLRRLRRDHLGRTGVFYLDVSLAETLRRHATRPQATEFTPEEMRGWYAPGDTLGVEGERVLPETTTLDEAVALIAAAVELPLTGRDEDPAPVPVPRPGEAGGPLPLAEAQRRVWRNKLAKGFNTTDVPLEFCLLSGEVAEAFEAWRRRPEGLAGELADVALYLLSIAEMTGVDLQSAIEQKIAVNAARRYARDARTGALVREDP